MTTAREKLYEEILALAGAPPSATAEADVRKIMGRYRVQTKPGVHVPEGITARDALGARLLELLRENPPDFNEKVGAAIDEFRMQVKQRGAAQKPAPAAPKPKAAAKPATPIPVRPAAEARAERDGEARSPARAAEEPSDARPRRMVSEPVAGGPRKRGRTRSECPKCHSMGVVLARSYAGDEYYSCIYCGWQAFKPADDSDPSASLAVRLLGQSAPEK